VFAGSFLSPLPKGRGHEYERLTQEQFALRYGLDLDAVRNWEHKRRTPDLAAQSYLRVIERMPQEASEAQEAAITEP
jgi:putative transcriptional regulator